MSSGTTFYINKADLNVREKKIRNDLWDDNNGDWALAELNRLLEEDVDLKFRKINIVIKWVEYKEGCEAFRNVLNKYKIEFQETE